MSQSVPQHPGDDAGCQLQHPDCRAVAADATGPKRSGHQIRGKRLADRAEDSLIQAVRHEESAEYLQAAREGKAKVSDQENDKRGQQNTSSAPSVRQRARRVGGEGGHQIVGGVDQDARVDGCARVLRAQDQKRVARVAESEDCGDEQVSPVGPRQAAQAEVTTGLGVRGRSALSYQQHHQEGHEPRNYCQIEDRAHANACRRKQQHRQQWSQESSGIVAHALEAECATAVFCLD